MRIWILFFIYGVVAAAIQSVWPVPGDFFLLAVIYFGFYEELGNGLGLSLMLGFLLDVVSAAPLGASLFSLSLVFGLIRFLKSKIMFQTRLSRSLWTVLLSLFNAFVSLGLINGLGEGSRPFSVYFYPTVAQALVNGVLALFWFSFLQSYRDLTWAQMVKRPDILLKR